MSGKDFGFWLATWCITIVVCLVSFACFGGLLEVLIDFKVGSYKHNDTVAFTVSAGVSVAIGRLIQPVFKKMFGYTTGLDKKDEKPLL